MGAIGVGAGQEPAAPSTDGHDEFWSSGPASVALAAVAAAVDDLAAVDLTGPGTGELLDTLRGVEVLARRLNGISVRVIGEMDQRGLAAPAGPSSTGVLVRQVLNIGKNSAQARVRMAAATCGSSGISGAPIAPRMPLVAAGLADGGLSERHADAIVKTLNGFPSGVPETTHVAVEEFLVEQGRVLDPKTFEGVAREIQLMADPDGPEDERDAHEKMQLHLGSRRPDGLTKVWGLVDEVTAEMLRTAFGAMCSPSAERNRGRADPAAPDGPTTGAAEFTADNGAADPGAAAPDETCSEPTFPGVGEDDMGPDLASAFDRAAGDETRPVPEPMSNAGSARPTTTEEEPAPREADERLLTGRATGHPPPDQRSHRAGIPEKPPPEARGQVCPSSDRNGGNLPAGWNDFDPATPWRVSRPPYEWAPLGTVPGDYPADRNDQRPPPEPGVGDGDGDGDGNRDGDGDGDGDGDQGMGADEIPTGATDPPSGPGAPPDRRSAGTRRAQALSTILAVFLRLGFAPMHGGERPQVLVTIDEQSLRDRTAGGTLGYGSHISAEEVRMLACDARIIPAVLGGPNDPVDIGRGRRTFTSAARKAVLLRDRGCVFPGCDQPGLWTDLHHIVHWADGGLSDYGNATQLCRRHHTLIHRGEWQVRLDSAGRAVVIPPVTYDPLQRPVRNTLHTPARFEWPTPGAHRATA